MAQQTTPEIHQWIAQQREGNLPRDQIVDQLVRANWERDVSSLAVEWHEWTLAQLLAGRPASDIKTAILGGGWSAPITEIILESCWRIHQASTGKPVLPVGATPTTAATSGASGRTMTSLLMTSFEVGQPKVNVEVDQDDIGNKAGGFGLVCRVEGMEGFLAKRVDLRPPVLPGHARSHLAHVRQAKARLEDARKKLQAGPREPWRERVEGYLDEILKNSLSTHWCHEFNEQRFVAAVWFLQLKATGKDLGEHFSDDKRPGGNPPPLLERVQIANAFSQRMRTLRRPGLVHMDCTVDNIRLDRDARSLVMIDLDGCGIEKQYPDSVRVKRDDWDVPPTTLGKQERLVRVPPWYPQEGLKCGPNAGNYKFGERWVALDTIIRILSWGTLDALGWLPSEARKDLAGRYRKVRTQVTPLREAQMSPEELQQVWQEMHMKELDECRKLYSPLPQLTAKQVADWNCPPRLLYFVNLAQSSYFDPRLLVGSPADRGGYRSLYEDFSIALGRGEFND